MEKKRIMLLIHRLNHGGAEKILSMLSMMLENVYDVIVVTFDGKDQMYETGGKLIDLKLPASNNKIEQFFTLLKRIKKVKKIKRQENVVCSISFLNGPNLVNWLSRSKDSVVMSVRTYLSGRKMGRGERGFSQFIYNRSDCTVAISDYVRDDLVNNFNVKNELVRTIYNPCDVEKVILQGGLDENGVIVKKDSFNYVTVGRFHEAKGHWHLLRAFAQLCKKHNDVHLYMVGEGELLEKTKLLIKELNIESHVTITGFLKNPHSIVKQCDAFVFSSLYEGFGNVIVDALALSKPVISSDCYTGPRTILAPDTPVMYQTSQIEYAEYGILVPPGDHSHFNSVDKLTHDEQCLCEAMDIIKSNYQLRNTLSNKVVNRANDFSITKTKEKWIDLIESIVN